MSRLEIIGDLARDHRISERGGLTIIGTVGLKVCETGRTLNALWECALGMRSGHTFQEDTDKCPQ